jgi:alpha-mannosidase
MVLSQSPGEHEFNFWIYSHSGGIVQGCVVQETEQVHTPLIPVQSGPAKGNQPVTKSFVKIQPDIITMSALKLSEDKQGYILRVYNPSLEPLEATLEFGDKIKEIYEVNLEEVVIQKLEISPENTVKIQSNPKKITTIKIVI